MIARRDIGVGLISLLGGVGLLSGLLYYIGGSEAFEPLISLGSRISRQAGVTASPTPFVGTADTTADPSNRNRPSTAPDRQTPRPLAKPDASGTSLRVKLNNLTLHRCPGYECETVTSLPLGTKVVLLGDRDASPGEEWCRVRAGKTEGWVSRYYLE
jgi:hypothetical protein